MKSIGCNVKTISVRKRDGVEIFSYKEQKKIEIN